MMDLLEIMPWGREEVEQEREFLSEAWLSTPMLEENNDRCIEMGNNLGKIREEDPPKEEITPQEEMKSLRSNESFNKWMEMNDMELAMYQQSAVRQDMLKNYTEGCDWENSNSSIVDTTQALLQEFETVCEVYHDTLTPPHSRTPSPPPPPMQYAQQHFAQQQQAPVIQVAVQDPSILDLAQELAMLDEIIRDRAASLENVNPPAAPKDYGMAPEPLNLFGININNPSVAPVKINAAATVVCDQALEELIVPDADIPSVKVEVVSPALSPVSLQEVPTSTERFSSPMCYLSPSSVAPSSPSSPRPNTPSSSTCEEGEEASDPEWVPTKITLAVRNAPKRQRAKPYARKSLSSGYSSSERSEVSVESSKPRGRKAARIRGSSGHEDRKERKKEQNKNAATRYRQKKKAEAEEVALEEKEMEDKNSELRAKAADLAKEVSYLKKLMREMFKARGML